MATTTTLHFDAEDWAVPQTVGLAALNDNVDSGSRVLAVAHRTSSADATFHELAVASIQVSVTDNDQGRHGAGVVVT